MARILAFDYGTKRIGIAVTDPLQLIATGLDTVHPKDVIEYVKKYMLSEQVEAFVLGDPKQMDGSPSDSAQHVKGFATLLKKSFPDIPRHWVDERFTSKMAHQAIMQSGLKKATEGIKTGLIPLLQPSFYNILWKVTVYNQKMSLINDDLQDLLIAYCEPESELLQQIDRETNLKVLMPRMLSGHYQGRVLSMLSKMISPKRILEIGTFTGYATLCLAEGLTNDGLLYTLDINEELEDMVRRNFAKSAYNDQINYILGDATTTIASLDEVFDIVFIDADKKNNGTYYDLIFDRVRPGGIIIVDNVLWSGKVLQEKQDKDTRNITSFNDKIAADERVEKLILPVRDGLFVIRKK